MALQEIERGLLRAQPERFAQERSRQKLVGYGIAAGVLLLAAIIGTASLPAFWAHFSGMAQAGYDPVRPFRGAGMGFVGVVIALVFLWLFGLLFAHAAIFRARNWVERASGHRIRTGRTARFGDVGAYDRWFAQIQSGGLASFPDAAGGAGAGKAILQTVEDREGGRVFVWLEAADGRHASFEFEGAPARALMTPAG